MTNTESSANYTVTEPKPELGWKRPYMAFPTLQWIRRNEQKLAVIGCSTHKLPHARYDGMMDLVNNGLVERRNYVGGAMDGRVTLHLTPLGAERLNAVIDAEVALAAAKLALTTP